jgi:hypothetical protein
MEQRQTSWVLINRAAEETGYSAAAIRTKLRRGVWVKGRHWTKAPDNRVFINLDAVQSWVTQVRKKPQLA